MELISAIATAQGTGGVAIIRVSGEESLPLAKQMFSRKGEFEPNRLYAGTIDGGTLTDFGMCVYFKAPHSFTGEDTVEFHCHGGVEIARAVLKRTFDLGARPAEAGEFTRRAFLNGKLSLSAAEGLGEMISARSEAQAKAGYLLYGEKLTKEGKRLQALLKECLAEVDADVDYPEEDLSIETGKSSDQRLSVVESGLFALLKQYRAGKRIREGVNVVLCGKPNAGKSSLLNALLGYDRAIVSSEAGTTRDIVEASLELNGVLFLLTDTAGLREGEGEIEREGIRRARAALERADVVVWVREDDEKPALPEGAALIVVGSKSDLGEKRDADISVSAVTGEGIEELKERIYEAGFGRENDGVYLLEERHFRAVKEANEAVRAARRAISEGLPSELYAEDIKRAYVALGLISGESATEDIITEIFSKFCVGK